jgi:hypothetical protein
VKKEFIPPHLFIPISSLCQMKGRVSGLETKVQCPWKSVKGTAKDCIAEEFHVSKKEWKKWLASME